jgi:dephospho-CoA kinase
MLLASMEPDNLYIVDSIRTPEEVEAFRIRPDFLLIEVDASAEVRWQRMQSRGRSGDPTTESEFMAQEEAEAVAADSAGQALNATAALADIVISNSNEPENLHSNLGVLLNRLPDLIAEQSESRSDSAE